MGTPSPVMKSARPLPGMPAAPFEGRLRLGILPSKGLKKGDLIIVTQSLGFHSSPQFFYHYKLFPRVRWVQYVTQDKSDALIKNILQLAKTETTEGLSVLDYDPKVIRPWRTSPLGPFTLVQDGMIVAQCQEKDLDSTVIRVLAGKFDQVAENKRFLNLVKDWSEEEKIWLAVDKDRYEGKISFASYARNAAKAYATVRGQFQRESFLKSFLWVSECRPLAEISPMFAKFQSDDFIGDAMAMDIERHLGHHECLERVNEEFRLALKFSTTSSASNDNLRLAKVARAYDRRKDVPIFLERMMNSDELKPNYAKLRREYFQSAYDGLIPAR